MKKKTATGRTQEMDGYYYTTLQGEKLNLQELNKKQKGLLRRFYGLYRERCDFSVFCNAMNSSYNLKIISASSRRNGQYWINLKVLRSVIYGVLQDLINRLAIQQTFLKKSKHRNADFAENEEVLRKFLKGK